MTKDLFFMQLALVQAAFHSGSAAVKRVFTEQLKDEETARLRQDLNELTGELLNCRPVKDDNTAKTACENYKFTDTDVFFWSLSGELYGDYVEGDRPKRPHG